MFSLHAFDGFMARHGYNLLYYEVQDIWNDICSNDGIH